MDQTIAPEVDEAETTPPKAIDPHGLVAAGEKLATAGELAKMLGDGVSRGAVKALMRGPLSNVRHMRHVPGQAFYCLAEALPALEPHRGWIEERRLRGIAHEAAERAAKVARLAAKKTAAAPKVASQKPAPSPGPQPPEPSSRHGGPEIIVRRRRVG